MKPNHCSKCWKEALPGNCWCEDCHKKICEDMHARELLPVGKQSCLWDGIRRETQQKQEHPKKRRAYHGTCTDCGKQGDIYGHILGKPYCTRCLVSLSPHHGVSGPTEDMGPWQENAVKIMEDLR